MSSHTQQFSILLRKEEGWRQLYSEHWHAALLRHRGRQERAVPYSFRSVPTIHYSCRCRSPFRWRLCRSTFRPDPRCFSFRSVVPLSRSTLPPDSPRSILVCFRPPMPLYVSNDSSCAVLRSVQPTERRNSTGRRRTLNTAVVQYSSSDRSDSRSDRQTPSCSSLTRKAVRSFFRRPHILLLMAVLV